MTMLMSWLFSVCYLYFRFCLKSQIAIKSPKFVPSSVWSWIWPAGSVPVPGPADCDTTQWDSQGWRRDHMTSLLLDACLPRLGLHHFIHSKIKWNKHQQDRTPTATHTDPDRQACWQTSASCPLGRIFSHQKSFWVFSVDDLLLWMLICEWSPGQNCSYAVSHTHMIKIAFAFRSRGSRKSCDTDQRGFPRLKVK